MPPCTPGQAVALAEAALTDTLHAVLAAPARRRVLVLDGEPGPWLPPGFDIVPQCAGGLDERLAGAFAAADGPALLIGMDTPQLTPGLLAVDWEAADAWFGPAADGGLRHGPLGTRCCSLVRGVPMSTAGPVRSARPGLMQPGGGVAGCRGFAMSTPRLALAVDLQRREGVPRGPANTSRSSGSPRRRVRSALCRCGSPSI